MKRLEHLVDISSAIIETPILSLKDFGIVKDPKTLLLTYTGQVSPAAMASYAAIGSVSVSLAGMAAIVSGSFLCGLGVIAGGGLAGATAAAGGLSATGVGITVAPFVLAGGYLLYRNEKKSSKKRIECIGNSSRNNKLRLQGKRKLIENWNNV